VQVVATIIALRLNERSAAISISGILTENEKNKYYELEYCIDNETAEQFRVVPANKEVNEKLKAATGTSVRVNGFKQRQFFKRDSVLKVLTVQIVSSAG
jgi:hypothetical protein